MDEHILRCIVRLVGTDRPTDESVERILIAENQGIEGSTIATEESIHKQLVADIAPVSRLWHA